MLPYPPSFKAGTRLCDAHRKDDEPCGAVSFSISFSCPIFPTASLPSPSGTLHLPPTPNNWLLMLRQVTLLESLVLSALC